MGKELPIFISNEAQSEDNPTYVASRQINIAQEEVEEDEPKRHIPPQVQKDKSS